MRIAVAGLEHEGNGLSLRVERPADVLRMGIAAARALDRDDLALHGAMICAVEKDPEGAVLVALRARLGRDVPIAVSLDLDAHVAPRMAEAAFVATQRRRMEMVPFITLGRTFQTGALEASVTLFRKIRRSGA
jgi:microcystin degradation protein MlrC